MAELSTIHKKNKQENPLADSILFVDVLVEKNHFSVSL